MNAFALAESNTMHSLGRMQLMVMILLPLGARMSYLKIRGPVSLISLGWARKRARSRNP
jgi:hypothetical protein